MAELLWEPTLSAMGACLDLDRCRGIADKVGSHQGAARVGCMTHRGVRKMRMVCGWLAVDDAPDPHKEPFAMSFRITGLDPQPYVSLYGLDEASLKAHGVIRVDGHR